ncbi:MAG: Hsp70 family protein [Deltaproteobacteria bacterium]|nr:Hsp70 family protein [Deltaproteobacteria bacterium]
MTAVGIDLGTSFSSVAVVRNGRVMIAADSDGVTAIPSIVHFPAQGPPIVGYPAREMLLTDPENTVFSAKRLIGRRYNDAAVNAHQMGVPYRIVEGPNGSAVLSVRGEYYSVPEVAAYVLRHMKRIAEQFLGQPVDQAVVTVPANFNDAQREATRIAGRIAGLEVLRVLNEPTAAALSYGLGRGYEKTVAVYDFGGGTFDFTVLEIQNRIFRVVTTAGDTLLGGDDLDTALSEHVNRLFMRQTGIDLHRDLVEWQRLLFGAEKAKRELSEAESAEVRLAKVAYRTQGALDLAVPVSRWDANALWKEFVGRSLAVCDRALADAGRTANQVDEILLCGGTTYIPLVKAAVEQYFHTKPRADVDPMLAVALGAAMQAAALSATPSPDPRQVKALLLDVIPLTIGIAAAGGMMEPIIERNAAIPVEKTRRFSTSRDGQTEVKIRIYQGESRKVAENTFLGELVVGGLRPAPRGTIDIDVTFEVDTDGILNVSARDLDSGRLHSTRVKISGDLSEDRIAQLRKRYEQEK